MAKYYEVIKRFSVIQCDDDGLRSETDKEFVVRVGNLYEYNEESQCHAECEVWLDHSQYGWLDISREDFKIFFKEVDRNGANN